MAKLYEILSNLCAQRGITGYKMCKDLGMQPSIMTDLKMGRRSGFNADTAANVANYFGVTVDYLLGKEEKSPSSDDVEQSKAFFRLKKGLEPYNISEDDAEFLLTVFKAHKSKNK